MLGVAQSVTTSDANSRFYLSREQAATIIKECFNISGFSGRTKSRCTTAFRAYIFKVFCAKAYVKETNKEGITSMKDLCTVWDFARNKGDKVGSDNLISEMIAKCDRGHFHKHDCLYNQIAVSRDGILKNLKNGNLNEEQAAFWHKYKMV